MEVVKVVNTIQGGQGTWSGTYRYNLQLHADGLEHPGAINTDKEPTYTAAHAELKTEGRCPEDTQHRQVKYLNNIAPSE
jgi:hypothetical protein